MIHTSEKLVFSKEKAPQSYQIYSNTYCNIWHEKSKSFKDINHILQNDQEAFWGMYVYCIQHE